ncbi:hypothetical protein Lysil_1515 [Lysobacter silvestris]|uniref:Uncharacterized protein n=2 Tax=Solilutibacter silvestris TaxID=1645665 RepID=A0A2K1PX41_9GAMM|nr:hypothetical protein Lysil_1515 [Lysobacter silvestris]
MNWHRMMATGVCLTSNGYESRSASSLLTTSPAKVSGNPYQAELDYRHALNRVKRIVFFYRHPRISRRCGTTHYCQFFQWIMTLTEWVFLHSERFKPQLHLFENIDTTDLDHEFLFKWASGGKTELLDLESRIEKALINVLASIEGDPELAEQIDSSLADLPGLTLPDHRVSEWLMFPPAQTTRLRAWLELKGYFRANGASRGRLAIQPLFRDLINQDVKADHLSPPLLLRLGTLNQADAPQQAGFTSRHSREKPSINIEQVDQGVRDQTPPLRMEFVDMSRLHIRKLSLLSANCDAGLPPSTVWSQVTFAPTLTLDLEPKGSTPTAPPEVALHCLGHAIRFVLSYGDDLVDYAIKVKNRLHAEQVRRAPLGISRHVSYLDKLPTLSLRSDIPTSLAPLRIDRIHSIFRGKSTPIFSNDGGKPIAGTIREHMGLVDALHLLEACMFVIVGTTAARRQIELRKLEDDCLAKIVGTGWYLKFGLGKDILGNAQGQLTRCIPNLAATAVGQIRRLNRAWRSLHQAASKKLLYGVTGNFDACGNTTGMQINQRLDLFCDYIEVPLDENGHRWYLRTHEMRRFWAYSFFYKFGLGELHTIGWFLGHRESEQTWAYIRESFDGRDNEMRQIKAAYASSILGGRHLAHDESGQAVTKIREVVLKHFGCSQLTLIDSGDLQAYLENILEDGILEIEPKFIRDVNGADYEIMWIVRPKDAFND